MVGKTNRGILLPELRMGVVAAVNAKIARVNLKDAGAPSGTYFEAGRYGRGEVGEFVLVEGQQTLLLGRMVEIRLPEKDRRSVTQEFSGSSDLDAIGSIQLLGTVSMADDLKITAGVEVYPRLGDRVYAAPHQFVALIPALMETSRDVESMVRLELGSVGSSHEGKVTISPEKLFGRHCGILGATGGGKSWTTARIIEECLEHNAKLILIDASGEYRNLPGDKVEHCHLGDPVKKAKGSIACSVPPTAFQESDFIAMFEPAGKVQGPKLRAAIRSLRLAKLKPTLAQDGIIRKLNQPIASVEAAEREPGIAAKLDDPRQEFEVRNLVKQIEHECAWPPSDRSPDRWGSVSNDFTYCNSLLSRISGVLTSPAFDCVFGGVSPSITDKISAFAASGKNLLRICLSGIAYEFKAREIIANAIGRCLLNQARSGNFQNCPLIVFVDEAHNFLGGTIGGEDTIARLDAFEIISKEGRKYGLNVCLATQRPRDITEGVLSQLGTLIVHRLTNDRDREVVERACGEIDRSASSFLPNLKPGEAAIIGIDFPIPLTIQMRKPTHKPVSDGPNYQKHWTVKEEGSPADPTGSSAAN